MPEVIFSLEEGKRHLRFLSHCKPGLINQSHSLLHIPAMGRASNAAGVFFILLSLVGMATVAAVEWEAVAETECDGRQCVKGVESA